MISRGVGSLVYVGTDDGTCLDHHVVQSGLSADIFHGLGRVKEGCGVVVGAEGTGMERGKEEGGSRSETDRCPEARAGHRRGSRWVKSRRGRR